MKNFKHIKIQNLLLPFLGLASLIWFLVRVIPKPSRASYPCMRVAAPLASSFVLYMAAFFASMFVFTKAKRYLSQSKYLFFSGALLLSLGLGIFAYFGGNSKRAVANIKLVTADPTPNEPMGTGKGVCPGRVAWEYDRNATDEGCENTDGDYWFDDLNTDQAVVCHMFSDGLQSVTNTSSDAVAWDSIFHYYNRTHGRGDVGYTPGEKIVIKVNYNAGGGGPGINTSPQISYALLNELINTVGVAQADIGIGDPHSGTPVESLDKCQTAFPDVNFWSSMVISTTHPLYTADDNLLIYLPQDYLDATYMINMPVFKKHHRAGISLCSKNHFGSVCPQFGSAEPVHYSLPCPEGDGDASNGVYGSYRIFVDFMGCENLGGKTILYVIDGLWSSVNWGHPPIKWRMAPFNNDYPNSIFMSQDPVAIESVGFDFLYKEFDANHPTEGGTPNMNSGPYPHFPGVDDFLHQAADHKNWPTGIFYAPNEDGYVLKSLGTHEHWNNATDKKYSRNLGLDKGIELVLRNTTGIENKQFNQEEYVFKNFPNPFNSYTTIQYHLNVASSVSLIIYDTKGSEIKVLVSAKQDAGLHKIIWNRLNGNGVSVSPGIYFGKITARSGNDQHYQELKMVINK